MAVGGQVKPLIVFLPHFGGSRLSVRRHADMLRALGYATTCVDLLMKPGPLGGPGKRLIPHWTDQLEEVLNATPGDKVLYSFSFPSAAVPALLSQRPRQDVTAWICDGGPFLNLWECQWNYFTVEAPVKNPVLHFLRTCGSYFLFGGRRYHRRARRWMRELPTGLPILSLRAGKDRLVPASAIAKFFATPPARPRLRTEVFPEAGHLEGLKLDRERYVSAVADFLVSV